MSGVYLQFYHLTCSTWPPHRVSRGPLIAHQSTTAAVRLTLPDFSWACHFYLLALSLPVCIALKTINRVLAPCLKLPQLGVRHELGQWTETMAQRTVLLTPRLRSRGAACTAYAESKVIEAPRYCKNFIFNGGILMW